MLILPLTNNPEESYSIDIFGVIYNLRQLRNTLGFWTLDIRDQDGVALVLGVKIVSGIYLLAQYPNVRFDLYSSSTTDPDRNNFNEYLLEVINKDV